MKHIKSYDQFLNEADTAKEIEKKINKMGEVSDDEKELEKDMEASKKGATTPEEGTKSEDDNEVKEAAKNEDHEEMDDEIANMSVSDMLGLLQDKDPKAYSDMEEYIKKNFTKAAKEGNFFTTMTA
tara:strand:+ start:325 stop:702 length:378 start_codon:yes stop_codon:yes gene_type:complete